MNMEQVLKDTANIFMAAVLAKRVAGDLVRQAPYQAVGAATVLAVWGGVVLARRRRRVSARG